MFHMELHILIIKYLFNFVNCLKLPNTQKSPILQLIYNFDGKNKKPNISERRYNRVQLKLDLTDNKDGLNDYDIELIMSDELKAKLEEKLILNKDIKVNYKTEKQS